MKEHTRITLVLITPRLLRYLLSLLLLVTAATQRDPLIETGDIHVHVGGVETPATPLP